MRQVTPQDFHELEPQYVREYWDHKAHDFTPWLAEAICSEEVSYLEDVLSLDLEVTETEKSVGKYNVDIVAEAVDEASGFANFRETATKTNSLIDRLKAIELPDVDDVADDLDNNLQTKKRAEELDKKIEIVESAMKD